MSVLEVFKSLPIVREVVDDASLAATASGLPSRHHHARLGRAAEGARAPACRTAAWSSATALPRGTTLRAGDRLVLRGARVWSSRSSSWPNRCSSSRRARPRVGAVRLSHRQQPSAGDADRARDRLCRLPGHGAGARAARDPVRAEHPSVHAGWPAGRPSALTSSDGPPGRPSASLRQPVSHWRVRALRRPRGGDLVGSDRTTRQTCGRGWTRWCDGTLARADGPAVLLAWEHVR